MKQRVKIFSDTNVLDLENKINNWLINSKHSLFKIKDIKHSTTIGIQMAGELDAKQKEYLVVIHYEYL
jgi:hypothetical protein